MSSNPYQAPTGSLRTNERSDLPMADGRLLVVEWGTVLPPACVKTNQPVSDEDMVTKTLHWHPSWIIVFLLFGGLPLIIALLVTRKRCRLTYGLHPTVRRKYRKRLLIKSVAAIAFFGGMFISGVVDAPLVMMLLLLGFVISIIVLASGNSPLRVKNYRKGNFWIEGCSPEFLARPDLNIESP